MTTKDTNLWSSLLREASNKRLDKLPDKRRLLLLGDSDTGKTTLVAALNDAQQLPKCYGMEFRLMEVKDSFRGDRTELGIYIMDGDSSFMSLLRTALTPSTFEDFTVIITLNMSKPWSLVERLQFWLDKLQEYIQSLDIPVESMEAYRASLVKRFAEYTEEDDLEVDKTSRPTVKSSNPASDMLMTSSFKKDEAKENILPLPKKALTENLGIPIIVVVTKTDSMTSTNKDYNLLDEQFDFIQMHLRRICLSYGAALIYTSIKEKKNDLLLRSYIQHRIYGFSFQHRAYVVEKDCVFIPSGWDSEHKISLLEGTMLKVKPNDNYAEVVPVPKPKILPQTEPEVVALEHQQFLGQLFSSMQRESGTGNANDSGVLQTTPNSSARASTPHKTTPNQNRPRASVGGGQNRGTPNSSSNTPGQHTNDRVLMNFFENLLNKPISPLNPTSNATPGKPGSAVPNLETEAQAEQTPVKKASED